MQATRPELPEGLYWNGDKPNIYWQLRIGGKNYGGSTGTNNIRDAKKFRQLQTVELIGNQNAQAKKGVRVSELFLDYIAHLKRKEQDKGVYMGAGTRTTSDRTEGTINGQLLKPFGNLKPEQVTTVTLASYRDNRKDAGASVVSINRELGYLRTALRMGTRTTPRKVNPLLIPSFTDFINVKAEKQAKRKGIITADRCEKLLNESAPHLRAIFSTVMYTGIRSKELKFIRPEQVSFEDSYIQLRAGETKNSEPRKVGIKKTVKSNEN